MITSIRCPGLTQTAIICVLASGLATIGAAADSSDMPRAIVKFGDLNLSNPQGAAKLYSRVVAAADMVCKPFDINSRNLGSRARLDACVHKAIAGAVTTIGRPELFAIYNAKNHKPVSIVVATAQTR